jgi:pilus assembly protein CpaE
LFGTAANNGQMIAEISKNHRTSRLFLEVAQKLTGLGETRKRSSSLLAPLMRKLGSKSA